MLKFFFIMSFVFLKQFPDIDNQCNHWRSPYICRVFQIINQVHVWMKIYWNVCRKEIGRTVYFSKSHIKSVFYELFLTISCVLFRSMKETVKNFHEHSKKQCFKLSIIRKKMDEIYQNYPIRYSDVWSKVNFKDWGTFFSFSTKVFRAQVKIWKNAEFCFEDPVKRKLASYYEK